MQYVWEDVGDQDGCIRKICYLGPYLLEHVESDWEGEKLMMASNVYLWNDQEKLPELIKELPLMQYELGKSVRALEDWYGANVLFEKLLLGAENEKPGNKKLRRRQKSRVSNSRND